MCGVLGLVGSIGCHELSVQPVQFAKMRDLMTHRGPDGEGLTREKNVMFANRRLAVIDPDHGQQPMWTPDRRFLLVYNGELYNDAELRAELQKEGVTFRTKCDTETVLHAFATWGEESLAKLRGMFAFGIYDFKNQILTLARDPLGIKPLYFALLDNEVIFSSHIPSMLAHPAAQASPNLAVVSSYLTTVRTTLGNETLFNGVQTLRPGQLARIEITPEAPKLQGLDYWREPTATADDLSFEEAVETTRDAVVDSVARHLRSDVSRCVLLSGGLDSSIIAAVCREIGAEDALQTWCASDRHDDGGDQEYARLMADFIGADHHKVLIDGKEFGQYWQHLVNQVGLPLSTPNETAIYAVAKDLKRYATVALSGEGADELFAGYSGPFLSGIDGLRAGLGAEQWPGDDPARSRFREELVDQYGTCELGGPVEHYLRCNSWIAPEAKGSVFAPAIAEALGGDTGLISELNRQFEMDAPTLDPAYQLLNVHRRINLTGLLRRLDTATMLAGVEGRTPFADVRLAELAMRLPLDHRIRVEPEGDGGWSSSATVLTRERVTTKRVLRAAFAEQIPGAITQRPKVSFQLPFERWLGYAAGAVRESAVIRELIRPEVINLVCERPAEQWQTAWPILNLGLWCQRWWG